METKRFIGNDMTRLYDRVRKELGRDAVILRTRTLARDGSSPLIELVAARQQGEEDQSLDIDWQRTMLDGMGSRLATAGKVTMAELEAMLEEQSPPSIRNNTSRNNTSQSRRPAAQTPISSPSPARHEPGEGAGGVRAGLDDPQDDGVRPLLPALERVGRGPLAVASTPVGTIHRPRGETTALASRLQAAGLTAEAVEVVLRDARGETTPARAVAAVLTDRAVTFPEADVTAIVTVLGSPGSGRTTALMKMALDCADSGREAILVAADIQRMGARQQLHAFGEAAGLDVLDASDARQVTAHAAKVRRGTCLFVDVPSGSFEPPPLPGIVSYTYLSVPAHWQGEAMEMGLASLVDCSFDGCILTFTDLAPSLAPAVSLLLDSPLGIAFVSGGRDIAEGMGSLDFEVLASGLFPLSTGERTNGKLVASA